MQVMRSLFELKVCVPENQNLSCGLNCFTNIASLRYFEQSSIQVCLQFPLHGYAKNTENPKNCFFGGRII